MRPRDPKLFQLMCDALTEGLERLRQLPKHQFIAAHYGWGTIDSFSNGLPHFSESFGRGPTDYSKAFGHGLEYAMSSSHSWEYPIQVGDLKCFEAFVEYAIAVPKFFDFFTKDDPTATKDSMWSPRYYALQDLTDTIDWYIHTHGMEKLNPELVLPRYVEWENGIFETKHAVQVLIPFLLTKFEFDSAPLVNGMTIERMTDGIQLSRMMMLQHRYEAHPLVASAASHALVLDNYSIEVDSQVDSWRIASEPAVFPLEIIDLAFAAVRVVSGVDTGYAQLLLRPVGWVRRWTAKLPPLHGSTARRYPSRFDQGSWLEPATAIGSEAVEATGRLLAKLLPHADAPLGSACRRLNDSFLRDREDDALVDALIAVETLLSDDEPWELTHKLALRAAALSKLHDPTCDPVEVMRRMKRVYAYRSKIVHGKDASKIRDQFANENSAPLSTATETLRMLIEVLASHPKFIGGTQIDHQLLLGRSDGAS